MRFFAFASILLILCPLSGAGNDVSTPTATQTILAYELDIFYQSKWVGDTASRVEKTQFNGRPAIKSTRTTQIVSSIGRIKPMFTQLIAWSTEEGDPIELRYTYSSGTEAQEMRVFWENDRIVVERRGLNGGGSLEPTKETVPRASADKVGGSPLDSLLLGSAGKRSSVALSMDFNSKKLEENRIEYVGEATVKSAGRSVAALEYRVMRKSAVLYKVFLEDRTDLPLRIESIDGMLMLPKKRP